MEGTSSTSLLGEKSRGPLQDLAFLPQDLILAPQPLQLSRQVLLPFGRRRLDLVLTALVEPAPQRRKADAEVPGDLPLRPTTHLNQPNGFGGKFLPEPSLRLAHKCSSFLQKSSPLSQGKSSWLNMVEIEISALASQCLDRRIESYARLVA